MPLARSIADKALLTVVSTGVAAGDTNITNLAGIPMLGFESIMFLVLLGALTATQVTTLKLQESPDNSTWTDVVGAVAGPAADADGGKALIVDLYRPQQPYVRAYIERSVANAVISSVLAFQYNASQEPVTPATADVSAQTICMDNQPVAQD